MNTIKDNKNTLLKRREIKAIVQAPSNPSFEKASELIAHHTKSSSEAIVINNVRGKFGRDTFLIDAFVYGSKEDKEKVEQKPRVKKAPGAAA